MDELDLLDVAIPIEEWEDARRIANIITDDERSPTGQVRVRADGNRRRWYATDSYRAMIIDGGPDSSRYDVGVSPTILTFVDTAASLGEDPRLCRGIREGRASIGVVGGNGSLWVEELDRQYPDVGGFVPTAESTAASATMEARSLYQIAFSACIRRENAVDDEPLKGRCWIEIGNSSFEVVVVWPGAGSSRYRLAATDVSGDVEVEVNPHQLQSLVEMFSPSDQITLEIPRINRDPIALRNEKITALLMPLKVRGVLARERVEEIIGDLFGSLAIIPDQDGDYPLLRRSVPVYARLVTIDSTPTLQVFAVVLEDIEASPELLNELNDLNKGASFARVFHVESQVLAEVDLVAETLDHDELRVAVERIRELVVRIAPTIALVFGGQEVVDPSRRRLNAYRSTTIEAEIQPGLLRTLNGPHAATPWPFPGCVHVLTGWNPQGAALDESSQENINIAIAEDILRHGARFVQGAGSSLTGDHSEPSLIAWGLTRDEAIEMGAKANQDAVFELDDDTVYLVSCIDETVDTWPRIEATPISHE
jgi:hypothetical protein